METILKIEMDLDKGANVIIFAVVHESQVAKNKRQILENCVKSEKVKGRLIIPLTVKCSYWEYNL